MRDLNTADSKGTNVCSTRACYTSFSAYHAKIHTIYNYHITSSASVLVCLSHFAHNDSTQPQEDLRSDRMSTC